MRGQGLVLERIKSLYHGEQQKDVGGLFVESLVLHSYQL